ncbi:hypothetical protein B0J18DRAFT_457025 [Chaetomium sp. MPI-SDFR-AT-0129]|nr:hypothetical protein B0J18DRAFT_457025 [Chaetomium sp. MPI-SDFR-AT-0129]
MAPVQVETEPGLLPLALAISRVTAAAYASYTVGRSLYRSHQALGPAHDTRSRKAERTKLTTAFGSLAALGLVFAVTSGLEYLTLSYKVWASQRGVAVPELSNFFRNHTQTADGTPIDRVYLQHWLSDVPVFTDALEIIAEKSRRLWWGQQLDLATISWTALLAIEGRRREIPHLWAYALLPHLVSLSFAQNLFYVALLQTPSPIPPEETRIDQLLRRVLPAKPRDWAPKLPLLLVPLVFSYLATLWLPSTAGTPTFPAAVLATKLLTLAPLAIPALVPASWGTVHREPRDAYPNITKLFNVISGVSALLQAKSTVSALLYNLPGSYKHRHSIKFPFDTEKRSKWERTATAVEKVLDALTDHPVVAAAGKDVFLSALSLGLWAAVRSTDVRNMLRSLYPALSSRQPSSSSANEDVKQDGDESTIKVEPLPEEDETTSTSPPPLSMNLRRRNRKNKASISSIDDLSSQQSQSAPTTKRRGRGRKPKHEPEPEPEPEPEAEAETAELEPEIKQERHVSPEDKTYEPTPAVKAAARLGDVVPEGDFDWEPAALAWGLTALGGLGIGTAAVFGAECLAR